MHLFCNVNQQQIAFQTHPMFSYLGWLDRINLHIWLALMNDKVENIAVMTGVAHIAEEHRALQLKYAVNQEPY
jgi:hypothetical protein